MLPSKLRENFRLLYQNGFKLSFFGLIPKLSGVFLESVQKCYNFDSSFTIGLK